MNLVLKFLIQCYGLFSLGGGGASTLNLGSLGKTDLFAYYGRAFHYLQLKKKSLRPTKIVPAACIFMSTFIGLLSRNGLKNAD